MNALSKPSTRLSKLFTDWLPESLVDRDFFDPEYRWFPTRLGVNVPSVNIRETPKDFVFEVAAPGLQRSDFKIEVEDLELTISAEREEKKEEKEGEDGYTRKEYSYGTFSRCFTLPSNIKQSAIEAKYDNGILKVTVPKEKETPTKAVQTIPVK